MKGMQYFMSCEKYLIFLHFSEATHEIKYNIISWDISRKGLDFTEFCIPSLASRLSEFNERIWFEILVCCKLVVLVKGEWQSSARSVVCVPVGVLDHC